MTEVLYDVMNDSIFTSRIVSAISNIVPILLFVFLAVQLKSSDKHEKKFKIGASIILTIFMLFCVVNIGFECNDYFNNYFVNQYKNNNYKVANGYVSVDDVSNAEIEFSVGKAKFICKSKNYNNRGYHIEDFNEKPFNDGDLLKIYYVSRNDESVLGGYEDAVIVKIEKLKVTS
ncbi:MAG: hypothetical protein NC122_05855 [Faecalibacterium sp.]|nr:hypothetical protein [Ruminococcus sp.]MCM1391849.1 hypothetical protein [Ruminococcus sp.]MCM1485713.1 hypothetical protein [Faecalibacterium sp.]